MRIIVVGYGRLGSQVVKHLDTQQNEVIVIDKQRELLRRPDRDPNVRFMAGNATDPDLLREAGAEQAGALFALTRDENTNLMVAQVARTVFNIPKVMAVVYDPAREPSYRAAGIETMALTVAGAEFLVGQLAAEPPKDFTQVWERAHGHAAEAPVTPAREASGPMYVIVVGGGRVGYFLARALLENNVEVTIIESSKEIFDLVSQQVDCPVIYGDGSSTTVLEMAGARRANVFVAVTNHDQDNLIACQLAKQEFGVPKTISRVKNPANEALMQQLGVDITVSSTAIITGAIQSELPHTRIRQVLDLRTGQLEIMEYRLDGNSPVVGKQLRNQTFPAECNIVTIFRKGEPIVPRGDTVFQSGDVVLILVKLPSEPEIRKLLLGA
ncbi:MAG: NAD-binding protein [Acidobacteria bacterium]|nr:NAD-binding protein [Acidobacteriota bacterium]MBI3483635.1 NAD-binding protein [Acidobacteriota bacterium]